MELRLQGFLQAARERVAKGEYATPGPRLEPNGGLKRALLEHPTPVIAELKPRSPSEGALLRGTPAGLLSEYAAGGAAGLSILTNATFFGGSPALLRASHAFGLPTLMKDFVVDGRQLEAAAHDGASAVLLIERCFARPEEREGMVAKAHRLGLEVLLEVFSE